MVCKNKTSFILCLLTIFCLAAISYAPAYAADKCSTQYSAGKGSGMCIDVAQCVPQESWRSSTPLTVLNESDLCPAGKICCVYADEMSGAGGATAEQLQGLAAGAFNKLGGISGNTAGAATLIGRAVQLLMAFMGSIALVLYIYAGIVWMTASGAKDRVGQAQKILVWTTFGVIVMLGSYILASFLFKMF